MRDAAAAADDDDDDDDDDVDAADVAAAMVFDYVLTPACGCCEVKRANR